MSWWTGGNGDDINDNIGIAMIMMMAMVAQHIAICHAMLVQKNSHHDGMFVLMGICQCDPKIMMTLLKRLPSRFPPHLAPSFPLVEQHELPYSHNIDCIDI